MACFRATNRKHQMSQPVVTCLPCEVELPVVDADTCDIDFKQGEISRILIGKDGEPFTDFEDSVEHAARQSASSTADDAIRNLRGIGSWTPEFGDEQELGTLATIYSQGTATLNFKVYNNSDTNYQTARATSCNKQYRIWLITSDGNIYGGNTGILLVLKGREVIPESYKEKRYIEFIGKATMTTWPERGTYPLTATD